MMGLGIRTMGGEIGGHGINLYFNPVESFLDLVKFSFHSIHPLRQHLLPFHDKVELVLKVLFDNSDPPVEGLYHIFLETRKHGHQLFFIDGHRVSLIRKTILKALSLTRSLRSLETTEITE